MKCGFFVWMLFCLAVSLATGQGARNRFHVPGYPSIIETVDTENWFGNTYILFRTYKTNWMKAHIKCRTHGMEMLTVDSRAEFNFISARILQSNPFREAPTHHPGEYLFAWLAVSDLFNEGTFTNLYTGMPFPNEEFYNAGGNDPQPSNSFGTEHCGHIWYKNNQTLLNDITCTGSLPVICKVRSYD